MHKGTIHRFMGRKNISLEDSAYEVLRAMKRPGESFSGVVHRLAGRGRPSLLAFTKLLSPVAARDVERAIRDHRKTPRRRG